MELFLFAIYLIIWIGLTIKRERREGFYSIFFLFGLCGFAYFMVIPFEMYVRGEEYYFVQYWIKLGFRERSFILMMGVISLLGFYLGLNLSRYSFLIDKEKMVHPLSGFNKYRFGWFFRVLSSVIVVSGATLILYYYDLFTAQWDYTAAYGITYASPLYSFIKIHFLISLCLVAALIAYWERRLIILSLMIVMFVGLVGLLTSDKGPLLLAMLTGACFLEFRQISFKKFIVISSIGVLGVIIVVVFFNLLRTRIPIREVLYSTEWKQFSFTTLDPAGPLVSIVFTINDDLPLKYGKTYITSLGVLVPKVIWPNRPLTLSEEFGQKYIFGWIEGQGVGFSPLAEAYLNFHLAGPFLHFLAYGLILGSFLRFLRRRVFINQDVIFTIFVYIIFYYAVVMSFRGPLISFIKISMLFILPYCMFFVLQRFRILSKKWRV